MTTPAPSQLDSKFGVGKCQVKKSEKKIVDRIDGCCYYTGGAERSGHVKLKIKCRALWLGDKCILVDCEDYERVSQYKWVIVRVRKWTYAVRSASEGETVYMHRFILNCAEDKYVDHRNNNGLDNRRLNLRECSNSENQYNVDKKSNSSQKYKDIRVTKSGTYQVRMRTPQGRLTKTVKTEGEAVAVYNEWAKKYHGEFARLIVMPSGASAKNTL